MPAVFFAAGFLPAAVVLALVDAFDFGAVGFVDVLLVLRATGFTAVEAVTFAPPVAGPDCLRWLVKSDW